MKIKRLLTNDENLSEPENVENGLLLKYASQTKHVS